MLGVTDNNLFDSLMTQLRNSTIACSFLKTGDTYCSRCQFGHIPHVELLQFIATATFGAYFSSCPDLVTIVYCHPPPQYPTTHIASSHWGWSVLEFSWIENRSKVFFIDFSHISNTDEVWFLAQFYLAMYELWWWGVIIRLCVINCRHAMVNQWFQTKINMLFQKTFPCAQVIQKVLILKSEVIIFKLFSMKQYSNILCNLYNLFG